MIYDLTRTLVSGMPVYPGDPEVQIVASGAPPWRVSALRLGSHSGTHVDAPLHCIADGRGIDAFPLERFIAPGVVVDARGYADDAPIGVEVLTDVDLHPGMIVVVRTGWEAFWQDARYFQHPYLSTDLAHALVERRVSLVAVDALNVDSTVGGSDAAHAVLLGADILIAENLCNLAPLRCRQTYMFAILPLAPGALDGAPARALAWDVNHRFGSDLS
ncbi:MAG: cyclase [Roseiflexus castenholzii]|uniref:cyclase family protein n=1 Tax=Roseiflexus castenholzii TaxID=120962 RepID=UPI000CA74C31|nr:MAG: cyclase [Roseiflexus castenholzii]